MHYTSEKSLRLVGLAFALSAQSAFAGSAGFAVTESSVSGMGTAYAGTASGEDASTIYANPAGMSRLSGTQLVVMASAIRPTATFSPNGTAAAPLQTAGGNGGDPGDWNYVPAAYLASEISPTLHAGFGLNVPFGLKTVYDSTWIGRFQATKSSIQAINLNPALSWRATEQLTLAGGLDYQSIKGDLSNMVNYSALAFSAGGLPGLAAVGGPNQQGVTTMSGSDSAWGYNLGLMFEATPQTRFGLAYRSAIQYKLSGNVSFTNVPAALAANPLLANGPATLDVKVPDTFSASVFHQLNERWDVMADVSRTGWSSVQSLVVVRANGTVLSTTPENWRDTWRVAVGADYHYDAQRMARIGLAYDQTPVADAYRTARLPDQNRIWLALGGQYKLGKGSALDVAYAHLFMANAPITDNQTAKGAGNLIGSYTAVSSNIFGLQYSHGF